MLENFSGQRPRTVKTADPEEFLEKQNRFTAAIFCSCALFLTADESFRNRDLLVMYRNTITKMQTNHKGRQHSIGRNAAKKREKKWGGHPRGNVPFVEPDLRQIDGVDRNSAQRNEMLGWR